MSTIEGLVPFLEQYPNWVRTTTAIWVLFSAILLVILLFVPRNVKKANDTEEVLGPPHQLLSDRSHWEAVQANKLALDCSAYRMIANPNIYTYSRTACEVLAELRSNMRLLARYHIALEGADTVVPEASFIYDAVKRYISQERFAEPYGPRKGKLERLVGELEVASLSLSGIRTQAELIKWQSEDRFTIDDLFIANGFLDWIVGYQVKDKLTPAEISQLGPFYDRAFPYSDQSATTFAVRELRHYSYSDEGAAYITILSAFD